MVGTWTPVKSSPSPSTNKNTQKTTTPVTSPTPAPVPYATSPAIKHEINIERAAANVRAGVTSIGGGISAKTGQLVGGIVTTPQQNTMTTSAINSKISLQAAASSQTRQAQPLLIAQSNQQTLTAQKAQAAQQYQQ